MASQGGSLGKAAALDKEPAARAGFVTQAAGNDAVLAEQVRRLLIADEKAGTFLSAEPTVPYPTKPVMVPLGRRIGPYRVLGEIGHGGMGAVYRAKEHRPEAEGNRRLASLMHGGGST